MDKDLNNSDNQNSPCLKESDTNKSFVGKFKSHVSGIINNTPLSKWFRKDDDDGLQQQASVRRRDEDCEDEELYEMQPPTKRAKLPAETSEVVNNCNTKLHFSETPISSPITSNNVSKKTFNNFPEPVAGPSGIKSRKLLNRSATGRTTSVQSSTFSSIDILNGQKESDSEESTSGYSSVARIGSKEHVCESRDSSKQTSPLETSPKNSRSLFHTSNTMGRSLFTDRSLSPNVNSSLSSRRPSFNASTFGSPNFLDKTMSTKRIINSPFYSGKTIYGGASAYGRQLGRSFQDIKSSIRTSVQIKPVNSTENCSNNVSLGKTARRILDTLEQYTTPVNDAKKIPVASKKSRTEGLLTKYTGTNPYMVRQTKLSSNKELQVPSVSDLLKMKQRERLQDSTETVRQIATTSKSNLNLDSYKINTVEEAQPRHTNKIKTRISSVRQKLPPVNEAVSEVKLTAIPLPITTLPKFDLTMPPPESKKVANEIKSIETEKKQPPPTISSFPFLSTKNNSTPKNKETEKQSVQKPLEYKFSNPLVIAENLKSIVALNNFKFSEPVCKKNKLENQDKTLLNFKMPEYKSPVLPVNKIKNNGERDTSNIRPATELKLTGSVMDVLGKKEQNSNSLLDKFKPAAGTWECSTCLIRNNADKTKCVACETPYNAPVCQNNSVNNVSKQKEINPWNCESCKVLNNNMENICFNCKKANIQPVANIKPLTTTVPGFGDKFKPSGDTWECNVCMIRNKSDLSKCAACEALKPGGSKIPVSQPQLCQGFLGYEKQFKPPANTWECTVCMIRNKEELKMCAACSNPKPASEKKTDGSGNFGNEFKIKDSQWECSVCLIRNNTDIVLCQCCSSPKPGVSEKVLEDLNKQKATATFNFGINKNTSTAFSFGIQQEKLDSPVTTATTSAVSGPLIFGADAKQAPTSTSNSFTFGISTENKDTTSSISKNTTTSVGAEVEDKSIKKDGEKAVPFKFGVPSSTLITAKTPTIETDIVKTSESTTLKVSSTSDAAVLKPTFNFQPTARNGDINKTNLFSPVGKSDLNMKVNSNNSTTSNLSESSAATNKLFSFALKQPVAAPVSVKNNTSNQSETTKPLFSFGSKTDTPLFGTTLTTASVPNSVPVNNGFGVPSSQIPAKSFSFSGEAASNKSNTAFSFGTSATANKSVVTTTTNTTLGASSSFNFAPLSDTSFNFSGSKTSTAPQPIFNAPSGGSGMFGNSANTGSKNGIFNFGNSLAPTNNSQKAGFSFGTAANPPSFNFGATGPSTGGFNFSAGSAAPNNNPFDASFKPTFNFSEGNVTGFNATSTGEVTGRKIRRAVRRSQR